MVAWLAKTGESEFLDHTAMLPGLVQMLLAKIGRDRCDEEEDRGNQSRRQNKGETASVAHSTELRLCGLKKRRIR